MCMTPIRIPNQNRHSKYSHLTVPCGKCYDCLSMKRTQWTFRFIEECKVSDRTYFITLTYDDENIPRVTDNTSQLFRFMCFNKDHYQKWLKRVRKNVDNTSFSYYAVGEYGTTTARPHYHFLVFCRGENIQQLEQEFQKQWKYGQVDIFEFNYLTDRGAMHYITKHQLKLEGDQKYWLKLCENNRDLLRQVKPFSAMSKGLGKAWLSENIYRTYSETYRTYIIFDGNPMSMPRYYKQKLYGFFTNDLKAYYMDKNIDEATIRYENKRREVMERDHSIASYRVDSLLVYNAITHSSMMFDRAKKVPRNANYIVNRQRKFNIQT